MFSKRPSRAQRSKKLVIYQLLDRWYKYDGLQGICVAEFSFQPALLVVDFDGIVVSIDGMVTTVNGNEDDVVSV